MPFPFTFTITFQEDITSARPVVTAKNEPPKTVAAKED